jgi:hypothetical protein
MARPKFKQRCALCKENMVIMYSHRQFPKCVDCHMKEINKPVTDKKYKKLLDIPEELYRKSSFLRNIKSAFLRFDNLTENQVTAFKKTIKDLKEDKKDEE